MEAFSLLKYWRGGGVLAPPPAPSPVPAATPDSTSATTSTPNATTTAILTAVAQNEIETDDDNDEEDGPFFDLEFTVPDEADDSEDSIENQNGNHSDSNSENHREENEEEEEEEEEDDNNDEESEREFKFTLSPSSNDRSDPNLSLSPSDDLFFKGKLVPLEPSSFVLNSSEPNSKPQQAQFTASLLKSATKFRVFMLGFKKSSKSNVASSDKESNGSDSVPKTQPQSECQQQEQPLKKQPEKKLFTVKFKVEEVPIMSLFTRDNSSRGSGASTNKASQNQKHNTEESQKETQTQAQTQSSSQSPSSSAPDEKRFSKEAMQKYLKMVKPLYIRVSRRYAEKLRFSGQLNITSSSGSGKQKPAPAKAVAEKGQTEAEATETVGNNNVKGGQKQGNLALPAGLRVVCKHLGKSRSASSAAAAAPAPASAPAPAGLASSRRRDDSLLQQQDGIQGAILHCKRSFNASRECESSSQLPRSVSDPLYEVSPELSRKSTNDGKNKRL